jgi:hypothetical protein
MTRTFIILLLLVAPAHAQQRADDVLSDAQSACNRVAKESDELNGRANRSRVLNLSRTICHQGKTTATS